ncbi:hypothetical protein LSM04_006650 [Trypanosoma melophagium]|uniref:uncharacterized protein n=1 Tax=Trypanosoma melophagium TaxID=715481 RepID=UPI00351A34F8|nr:hypothetical protein LSM04_006650 [Trypanosoma melophagium]
MATAVVERPSTAQERVLASNNPPPPAKVQSVPSHRQRAAANNRGAGVAGFFAGKPPAAAEPAQAAPRKELKQSPSEFLSGPKEPGHVKHGVRRYDDRNVSTVGKALTEEWILGRGENEEVRPPQPGRHRGPKDNLEGLCCNIKTEEAKPRRMRGSGNAPPHSTMAPYSEPELPSQPVEPPHPSGRRRFKTYSSGLFLSPHLANTENDDAAGAAAQRPRSRAHRNRANESVDVLNLGQYSREELHEVERKVVLGPRQFTPASIPPRPRPTIARVKTPANETHDIFGTGRGADETEPVHRKNPGVNAPKRTGGSLFEAAPQEKRQVKPYRRSELLSYEECRPKLKEAQPAKEKVSEENQTASAKGGAESRQPQRKVESGMLFVSKSDTVEPRGGRGPGMYAPKQGVRNIY